MKKTTKKAAETEEAVETETASPVGDSSMRTLRSGTVVFLPGSTTPLTLDGDVSVSGEGIMKDAKFAGMLARDQNNWNLNIDQIEGTWNPVTCRREDEPASEG